MDTHLDGKKILFITSNKGVEKDELLKPMAYFKQRNALLTHAAIHQGDVQTVVKNVDKDTVVLANVTISSINISDYDALVIPGGTVNSDTLRIDANAVREFANAEKLIAAICHAPWILIESELVADREITSYHSIKTDLINAGATWLDQAVVKSVKNKGSIITSRNPDDLDEFAKAIANEFRK